MKKALKKEYAVPQVKVEDMQAERGFALSSDYGDYGEAGQQSGYLDSECEL